MFDFTQIIVVAVAALFVGLVVGYLRGEGSARRHNIGRLADLTEIFKPGDKVVLYGFAEVGGRTVGLVEHPTHKHAARAVDLGYVVITAKSGNYEYELVVTKTIGADEREELSLRPIYGKNGSSALAEDLGVVGAAFRQ